MKTQHWETLWICLGILAFCFTINQMAGCEKHRSDNRVKEAQVTWERVGR